jgi:superkiller protein 3
MSISAQLLKPLSLKMTLIYLLTLILFAGVNTTRGQDGSATPSQVAQVVERLKGSPASESASADAIALGQLLIREKRFAEAEKVFRALLENKPRDLAALYGLALAVFNQGRTLEAEPLAREAVSLALTTESGEKKRTPEQKSRAADALVLLAVVVAVKGDENEALKLSEQAVAIASDHFDAQFTLGRARYGAGDSTGAVTAFRAAVALKPNEARALFFLGTALERAGDIAGAISSYRHLIAKYPLAAEGHLGLGILLARGSASQIEEGINELKRAVSIEPNQYEARVNLGRALVARGRASESIPHLIRAGELAPDNPEPHYQLAIAYRRLGKADLAAKETARVKQIHESRRTPAGRNELQKTPEQ